MTGIFWLDWATLAVSLHNTILLLWLALTVWLNADRRTRGIVFVSGALLLARAVAGIAREYFLFQSHRNSGARCTSSERRARLLVARGLDSDYHFAVWLVRRIVVVFGFFRAARVRSAQPSARVVRARDDLDNRTHRVVARRESIADRCADREPPTCLGELAIAPALPCRCFSLRPALARRVTPSRAIVARDVVSRAPTRATLVYRGGNCLAHRRCVRRCVHRLDHADGGARTFCR